MTAKPRKKKKKAKKLPVERPATGWGPDTVRGLRWEQKKLRDIAAQIQAGVEFKNSPTSRRRAMIKELCDIVTFPGRYAFNSDVLKAALELYGYNDRVASCILTKVADEDYEGYVKYAKEN